MDLRESSQQAGTHFSQKFAVEQILFEKKSQFQHICVFHNTGLGRVLVLDNIVQTTELDEFIYHEMFAHVPLFSHPNPKSVLIIGGGDGGLLREVLRHPSVETVDMVEIDADVVHACRKFMPFICRDAYEDPRSNLIIDDALVYIQETEKTYDVILCDSTDPTGPSEALFSSAFFDMCSESLNSGGIFVNQCGIPFLRGNHHHKVIDDLGLVFSEVAAYQTTVPTYSGGPMVFVMATKNSGVIDLPVETINTRYTAAEFKTLCYNPAVHKAAFALPEYMTDPLWLKLRG